MLERMELILDKELIEKFSNSNILLVGVGGVGGACLEALVRLGLKNITIIDNDTFQESNLNRQILSNISNIDKSKAKEAVLRAKSINPSICANYMEMFLETSNIDRRVWSSRKERNSSMLRLMWQLRWRKTSLHTAERAQTIGIPLLRQ